MRRVRTASGAVAVQVVTKDGGRVVEVDHVGSAHTDADLELLLEAARQRLRPGQGALDLGELAGVPATLGQVADWTAPARLPGTAPVAGRPPVVAGGGRVLATSSLLLWRVLAGGYAELGFDALGDEAFRALVLARIIEPTSKADSIRVLGETGISPPSLRTVFRSLGRCVERDYRGILARACWAHATGASGAAALVLYDCTTLHFEIDVEDGLRRVGMSKERRVDPQVQVGLLVDAGGFPLEVHCFTGNTAETRTLIPVLRSFADRHGVADLVVVADAGMLSAANLNALEDAGFGFIVGSRISKAPYDLPEHFEKHAR